MASFCGLRKIPFVLYRSGTSRGLFLLESDVPPRGRLRDEVLCRLMGSGHPQQVGGFGGGCGPTSKVAVVGPHSEPNSVAYCFAQCGIASAEVDHSHGDCGNMLAAVAPFALERGILNLEPSACQCAARKVKIHSINTGAVYEAQVSITGDRGQTFVQYTGDCEVPGIPGPAAPLRLASLDVAGSQTGRLLPSGNAQDFFVVGKRLGSVTATLIDFARALVVVPAEEVLPKFGYRQLDELTIARVEHDVELCSDLEDLRLHAGLLMGMGDCSGHDAPKLAIVGSPESPGVGLGESTQSGMSCRYFVNPGRCEMHPTVAMTAAQALGAACLVEGSVANRALGRRPAADDGSDVFTFAIQHPKGTFPVSIGVQPASVDELARFPSGVPHAGRYTTTVMPIAEGSAFIDRPFL